MTKLITAKQTRQKFGGISAMTEWRWREAGILPPAIKINGRNYDDEAQIDAIIASRAGREKAN